MPIIDVLNPHIVVAIVQFVQYPIPNLPADCRVFPAMARMRNTGTRDANRPAYKYLYSKGDIMVFKVEGKVLTKEEMAAKQAKKDAERQAADAKVQAEAKAIVDAEKKKQAIKEAELAVASKSKTKKTSKKK